MPGVHRLARAAIVVMTTTLGSAILGFIRELLNARLYGTHWELDTFLAAAAIPTVLFGVFNGALISALVPVFSGLLAAGEEDEAWRLASTVFNLLFFILSGCAVLGWLWAPYYVPLIAHGFSHTQLLVAIRMTQWLMPSIIATSLAGVTSAMLNAHHRFSSAALQGVAMNGVTIAVVVLLNRFIGIYALTLGTTLGLFAQVLIQLPEIFRIGRYRPLIDVRHPGLSRIWQMLGPIIIGSAAGQIALCLDRFFASSLAPGSISSMNYAIRIVGLPLQLFAAAIATVIFPLLSAQFAGSNHVGIQKSVKAGLGMMNFITIPAVVLCVVLAHPIVATLFQGGAFDRSATDFCANLLPFAALGLLPQAATMVLSRCCFAGNESRLTVAVSVLAVVVNIVLSVLLLPRMGARGLLLANAISQWVQCIAMVFLVFRLVPGLRMWELLRSALEISAAGALMAIGPAWFEHANHAVATTGLQRLPLLSVELVGSGLLFLLIARMLKIEELDLIVHIVRSRIQHLRTVPTEKL